MLEKPKPILRLTNSEAATWRRCKRKWYLAFYRELEPVRFTFNRPLGIGNRTHEALAAYYTPTDRVDPVQWVKDSIESDVVKFPAQEDDIRKEGELCELLVAGYMQWLEETGEDSDLEIIAPEAEVEVPFFIAPEGPVTILSKIDARVRKISIDTVLALEHKTTGDLKQALPMLQLDTQLLTEHLVEKVTQGPEGRVAEGVLYNMLKKNKRTARAKPPFYAREVVLHNDIELRNHWRHMYNTAQGILEAHRRLDAGESHHDVCPPTPIGRNCEWSCDFYAICPMHDDGSDVEAPIADMYRTHEPLERYDLVRKEMEDS